MPRIILKCPYLKGGGQKASAHLSNLVTYMATRKGVEKLAKTKANLPCTLKQEDLIQQIIKEFPEAKTLFEYEDYTQNKSVENASEFISIALEQNLDKIGQRKNYVDYIANRPRVQRMGSHGLFTGGDDKIVLSSIAEEVANHSGNVWIPIISLRRTDAIRTGFDNAESWHNMLSYFAPEIAESMKIPIRNFRWYAAFHNESHHPHVHMVCYSTNPSEGYLTKKGIEKMKSGLVKYIFKNEMQEIYEQQTQRRDQLKNESRDVLLKLIQEMKSGTVENPKIEELFLHLSERLKCTTGKKVYGFLGANSKAIVDELIDELSKEPIVAKAYELWYEMREEVLHSYMEELPEQLPLSQQKEFKSIKNMIIAEAVQFSIELVDYNDLTDVDTGMFLDDTSENTDSISTEGTNEFDFEQVDSDAIDGWNGDAKNVYVKWTDEYKTAREFLFGTDEVQQDFSEALIRLIAEAQTGNILAVYDLGRIYSSGLDVDKNLEIAHEYYVKALAGFNDVESQKPWKYTEYRIGKMFASGLGTEQDYQKAAEWFELSAAKKYKYAQYSLGALYHRGQGVGQDMDKAFELYLKSAKQGFPYADFEVAKMFRDGVGTEKDEIKSEQHFKKAFQGFELLEKSSHDDKIQYRLGWMLQNGIGADQDIPRAKEYYSKSEKLGNIFSGFALAKLILKEENPKPEELQKAVEFLRSVADSDDASGFKSIKSSATYLLGKLFLDGKVVSKDISQAIRYLTMSAEENNEWASYQLGKLFLLGSEMPKDIEKAIKHLTISAKEGNQFAQYLLGKTYLLGKDVTRDKELALKWLAQSAEQGNEYAKFFLDNIDMFRDPSVAFCISSMLRHMSRIFEENMMPFKNSSGMTVDSKLLRKLKEKKLSQGHKNCNLHLNI
ncbi:sel1 repeat family protein [Candidatus Parcubacteria bacterium]|jgi:TPR repeat protein|nr:MAG: sel1 repeat family protein [Candidatus Parcubacteria bacterium]